MIQRNEYVLNLFGLLQRNPYSTATHLRTVDPEDSSTLAELMIDAYRGTIDYEGETLTDAVCEVEAYLAGERGGRPLLNDSHLAFADTLPVGACLVADAYEGQSPLIAYAMVRAEWKNRGIGKQVLWAALHSLREHGYRKVRAVITAGNAHSERLFERFGFQKVITQ
jgi:RimJ/RimL family protein N-acetyltransferase